MQRSGALRSVLAKPPTASSCRVILQRASQDLQLAMALLARATRDVELVEQLVAQWTHARLQVVQQICMQEADRLELVASRTRVRAWKDWASTTAMAGGARLTHRWIKQVAPWADASVDGNGLVVQPQEQADLIAEEWYDLWRVTSIP